MLTTYLNIAIKAAIEAGSAILQVYSGVIEVEVKSDESPLTLADKNANEIITEALKSTGIPIISEENKLIDYNTRKSWTDCWIVDPLDGTKEFIKRNGEFTVNIALISGGKPVSGVIYVPATKELYFAEVSSGRAFKVMLSGDTEEAMDIIARATPIYPADPAQHKVKVVGSRSHMNEDTERFLEDLKSQHPVTEIVSKGSSLKFCLVAEGKAHIYPRFAPTMEWDTAAGQAICEAVGLRVINQETGQALTYNKENLLNPFFLVSR